MQSEPGINVRAGSGTDSHLGSTTLIATLIPYRLQLAYTGKRQWTE
jgi:hypothetical protein